MKQGATIQNAQLFYRSIGDWWRIVKSAFLAWNADHATSMGAAIAYYTTFSIAPLLVIVTAVAGSVLSEEAVTGELYGQLEGLIGNDGAKAIQSLVQSASNPREGGLAIIGGVIAMLIGATGVFAELQAAIDRIWKVDEQPQSKTWWELIRTRVLAFGMVLAIAFLLTVSLIAGAAISAVGAIWDRWLGGWETVLQSINLLLSLIIFTGVFAAMYRFLPRIKPRWPDVWLGALVTAILFVIGKFLIGLYIGKSGVVSGFGAAGSIVTLLIWVYYSAQIFLLGAEFTRVYSTSEAVRAKPSRSRTMR